MYVVFIFSSVIVYNNTLVLLVCLKDYDQSLKGKHMSNYFNIFLHISFTY